MLYIKHSTKSSGNSTVISSIPLFFKSSPFQNYFNGMITMEYIKVTFLKMLLSGIFVTLQLYKILYAMKKGYRKIDNPKYTTL